MVFNNFKDQSKEVWYFHYFISNPSYLSDIQPEYFSVKNLSIIFDICKYYILKFKTKPSIEVVISELKLKHGTSDITEEYLKMVMSNEYVRTIGEDYLREQSINWLKISKLEYSFRKAIATMKSTNINDIDEFVNSVSDIVVKESKVITKKENSFSSFFDIESHKHTSLYRFSTGYKFLDDCLGGGYWKGSLISFLSGAKVGKSTWMTNLAIEGALNKLNVAVVSLELSKEMVMQRLACKALNLCMSEYTDLTNNNKDKLNNLLKEYKQKNAQIGQIGVLQLPTSRVTVREIEQDLLNYETTIGKKFDVIFIDYFNLIVDDKKTDNSYMKIKNVVENLRGMGIANEWAIVSPTQTNRSAVTAQVVQLENISESINVVQTVDALFSIETSDSMRKKGRQRLNCMVSRVSNKQGFYQYYNVNFNTMTITEDKAEPKSDEIIIEEPEINENYLT